MAEETESTRRGHRERDTWISSLKAKYYTALKDHKDTVMRYEKSLSEISVLDENWQRRYNALEDSWQRRVQEMEPKKETECSQMIRALDERVSCLIEENTQLKVGSLY